MSDESEVIFSEYQKHRDLLQRLVLRNSEQADATFELVKSIGFRLAEQIYMERQYAAVGKVWKE